MNKKGRDVLAGQLTPEKGVSEIGIEVRRGDTRQKGIISHGYGRIMDPKKHMERAKAYIKEDIQDLKAQPAPKLPKSEQLKKCAKVLKSLILKKNIKKTTT